MADYLKKNKKLKKSVRVCVDVSVAEYRRRHNTNPRVWSSDKSLLNSDCSSRMSSMYDDTEYRPVHWTSCL